jgi:Xaa-Pro aminopeptidase
MSKTPQASHDVPFPQAFLDFMMQGWKPPSTRLPPRVRGLARFAARREALSQAFAGEVLIVPTGVEKVRANDTHYRFRPGSDFYYLTGNMEPDCVLVLWPHAGGKPGHEALLFVEPNFGRTDPSFFMDRNKGELWVGPRLGVAQSQHRYGVQRAVALGGLPKLLGGITAPWRVIGKMDPTVDAVLQALHKKVAPAPHGPGEPSLAAHLSEMRLLKDPLELAALRRACEATKRGFEDVIVSLKSRTFATPKSEREVEGVFNLRARVEGNDVGYSTIAASGAHACVLHWTHNDGGLDKGELLLLDAGVEGRDLYTADVTRTLPIGGAFSPAQRRIYECVLHAQNEALAAVRPGNDFMAPNRVAMQVLCEHLFDLGILKVSVAEAMLPQNQYYKRYTLHNVSHMLGIDVHDCAAARAQAYKYGALQPGMVLTVEPGLYLQKDDLTVPAKYRGIGVRIEDDVVVTRSGYDILSDLPRGSQEVEAWMQKIWRRAKKK